MDIPGAVPRGVHGRYGYGLPIGLGPSAFVNGVMKGTTRYHREHLFHMLKRFVMMFVCVAVALIAGSASALTPCNLSGSYVAVFTLVKPSLVSALGTFTFTPPADCSLPGTLSIDTLLGSASAIPYFVEGNELSIPGTPLDIRGLIGRTSPSDDGVAEGFVFHGFGVNTSFAGTALRSE